MREVTASRGTPRGSRRSRAASGVPAACAPEPFTRPRGCVISRGVSGAARAWRWLLASWVWVLAAGCLEKPTYAPRDNIPPDIDLHGVTLRQYRGGSLAMVGTAPRVQVERYNANLWAWDASVALVRSGATLAAVSLTGNLDQQYVEGAEVTLVTDGGVVATSPRVLFERSAGAAGGASSDAGLRLVRAPDLELEAAGFTLDFAEEQAVLDQPRTVTGGR